MSVETWAPGRVNLMGDHTDYNDGLCLPMAIHLGTHVSVKPLAEPVLVISSAQRPGEMVSVPIADLVPGCHAGWAAYVAGTAWSLGVTKTGHGYRIDVNGDVPLGAGLSSSASLEAAVAVALLSSSGSVMPPREIARACQRAENEFVGVPTGAMDQVAAVMGEAGSALLFDVQADTVAPAPLDALLHGATLLVVDSGVGHELASTEYAQRRSDCGRAAALLGTSSLREVTDLPAALAALDDDALRARVRHVVTENSRVVDFVRAVQEGDLSSAGRLMVASHESLRDDFQVSCVELDSIVEVALSLGVSGARMTGGGFGGSAVLLVGRGRTEELALGLRAGMAARGLSAPRAVLEVHPARGARVVR